MGKDGYVCIVAVLPVKPGEAEEVVTPWSCALLEIDSKYMGLCWEASVLVLWPGEAKYKPLNIGLLVKYTGSTAYEE